MSDAGSYFHEHILVDEDALFESLQSSSSTGMYSERLEFVGFGFMSAGSTYMQAFPISRLDAEIAIALIWRQLSPYSRQESDCSSSSSGCISIIHGRAYSMYI
jgi:hypothetical protein